MAVIEALARDLGARLATRGLTVTTAESCTGGWIAQAITSVAGSSGWFGRGFVTYSNAAKHEMLGVRRRTLEAHGAVSEETVREMARGALEAARADLAVAVSGIAGPGGATPGKPVGTVCLAWAGPGGKLRSTLVRYHGDREAIRRQAVEEALTGLIALCADVEA
ncbi:MAG: nicotinamide-nucleotide amidohydrolase family protein [Ectothiorhodospiraceae bacterium]|nr:nicotinamide-nucleotide amidohydrolase family protein [Chromatiales bacterium]MCP5153984.1 nicotinamide-nucleotide amidohydrolase family protein [Ectothiorhodospiraceae bacterium]